MSRHFIRSTASKAVLFLFILSSCAPKALSPHEQALKDKIEAQVGVMDRFSFTSIEKIGETTVGQEIDMRTHAFELRYQQNKKFMDAALEASKIKKYREKESQMAKDVRHILQLDSIRQALGDRVNVIAYYDYVFSANGKVDGASFEAIDWYASITPSGEVLSMVQDKKQLHKGLGVSIPGYKELFAE